MEEKQKIKKLTKRMHVKPYQLKRWIQFHGLLTTKENSTWPWKVNKLIYQTILNISSTPNNVYFIERLDQKIQQRQRESLDQKRRWLFLITCLMQIHKHLKKQNPLNPILNGPLATRQDSKHENEACNKEAKFQHCEHYAFDRRKNFQKDSKFA